MNKTICILVDTKKELQLLLSSFNNIQSKFVATHTMYECQTENATIIIMQTGLNKVSIALGTSIILSNYSVDLLINIGASSSLNNLVKPGDLVIADPIVAHGEHPSNFHSLFSDLADLPTEYYTDDITNLFLKSQANSFKSVNIHKGLVISSDKFITNFDDRIELLKHFPHALATDMESSAIGHACFYHGVPFIVIRLINDTFVITHATNKNYDQQAFNNYKHHFSKTSQYAYQLVLTVINNLDKIF